MAQQAHPAFPPLPASSSGSEPRIPVLESANAVRDLISQCQSESLIRDVLVLALTNLGQGKGMSGQNEKEKREKGETLLALRDEDLSRLRPEQIKKMTTGLVFVVSARLRSLNRSESKANADLFTCAVDLCTRGEKNGFRWCPARSTAFAWGLLRLGQMMRKVDVVVNALWAVISRDAERTRFWGLHAAFLESCLLVRHYQMANDLLDDTFVEYAGYRTAYLDVITFYHHAGLISAAQGYFGQAKEFFIIAVTAPTAAASAIQLASAKRAILCSLLDDGKAFKLPKYTANTVERIISRAATNYTKLAKAFEAGDWAAVREIAKAKEFEIDCNGGLLEQILESIPRRRILRIKGTYSRLTMQDLANKVEMGDADGDQAVAAVLGHMIASGSLQATIAEPPDAIVTFHDDLTDYTSPRVLRKVAELRRLSEWLESEMTLGVSRLGLEPAYLKKQAGLMDMADAKGSGKGGKADEYDAIMAGENFGRGGAKKMKGPGADLMDTGY